MSETITRIVAALMRRGDDVLLVRQQGPDDPDAAWSVPGGIVEAGETLADALRREVREETGLEVGEIGRLAYVTEMHNRAADRLSLGERPGPGEQALAFVFEVTEWKGEVRPDDPDDLILNVELMPVSTAIEYLQTLPWRHMREPAQAYLSGAAPEGSLWTYCRRADGEFELIAGPVP